MQDAPAEEEIQSGPDLTPQQYAELLREEFEASPLGHSPQGLGAIFIISLIPALFAYIIAGMIFGFSRYLGVILALPFLALKLFPYLVAWKSRLPVVDRYGINYRGKTGKQIIALLAFISVAALVFRWLVTELGTRDW